MEQCALCSGARIDGELGRVQVWEDALWRLTTSVGPGNPTLASSYLEPKRHIATIADLDGAEAATFGLVIARCSAVLRSVLEVPLVYVYVFGGGAGHLHVHLAPHVDGDALTTSMIRGELAEVTLPSGVRGWESVDFPGLPEGQLVEVADRLRAAFTDGVAGQGSSSPSCAAATSASPSVVRR
jgi:diadenosine tetraphosphate (Ap4A) HIT family hydrolase